MREEPKQEAPVAEKAPEPERSAPAPAPQSMPTSGARSSVRRGRAAMPSWDEIVFGARSDD